VARPENFADEYKIWSYLDFGDLCRWLFLLSRPDHKRARDTNYNLMLSEELQLDAFAFGSSPPNIVLTLGLFWALDDLVTRIVCLQGFAPALHEEISIEANFVANETLAIDNDLEISPVVRFFDYAPLQRSGTVQTTVLSRFFTAVPLTAERKALAQILLRIGLLWVILHEESHHVLGHLRYRRGMPGADQDSAIHEGADGDLTGLANFSKVCEWQADRDATRGVLDVVIRPAVIAELPVRFRSPKSLLRLVMVAIGCVVLLFDRARLIRRSMGSDEHGSSHPTERTRFLAAMVHVRGQNEHWEAAGRLRGLTSDDVDAALLGATRDLAVANRPASRELWPLPAGWEPPARSTTHGTAPDVLHVPDWDEAADDPFADLMLHERDDAHLGPMLAVLSGFPDPAGGSRHEELLRAVHATVRQQVPELSWENFIALYKKWTDELAAIVAANDSQVWDLLARYRDDRWL
jgi:hypothetical protein